MHTGDDTATERHKTVPYEHIWMFVRLTEMLTGDDNAAERHRVVPYAAVRCHVGSCTHETDRLNERWESSDLGTGSVSQLCK